MHAVPSPTTKVVTSRCQQNILCKSTPPLTIHLYDYDTWTYKQRLNNAKSPTHISTNNNVKVHLHLHWSTSTTIALSSIYVHTINQVIIQLRVITTLNIYAFTNNITINQHICIHQPYHNHSTYMYSPTISQSINIHVFTNIDFII